MKYNILYTTNNYYFAHMLTSIYSLLESNTEYNIIIHIIEDNISKYQRNLLENVYSKYSNVEIKIYSIKLLQNFIDKYNIPKWRNTDIANVRLFAHEILRDINKILYIDSDTIINNSLIYLFNNKSNTPISAVREIKVPIHMRNLVDEYYNSGVILFNYELWDKEDYIRRISDGLKNLNVELIFPDQDLINTIFYKEINPLTPDYNIFPFVYDIVKYPYLSKLYFNKIDNYYSYEEIIKSLNNPHIYHLLSYLYARPWIQNKIHPFNQIYDYYRKYWDCDYKKQEREHVIFDNEIIPLLNIITKAFLGNEFNETIKTKIFKKEI